MFVVSLVSIYNLVLNLSIYGTVPLETIGERTRTSRWCITITRYFGHAIGTSRLPQRKLMTNFYRVWQRDIDHNLDWSYKSFLFRFPCLSFLVHSLGGIPWRWWYVKKRISKCLIKVHVDVLYSISRDGKWKLFFDFVHSSDVLVFWMLILSLRSPESLRGHSLWFLEH